jgi:two-component system response regulator RegA
VNGANPPGRLLLVDDDPTFRSVLARAFRRRGFEVIEAADADGAVDQAHAQIAAGAPPDFAVVDLKLPDRSGLEVVDQLHRLHAAMRIVVLTGYASIATAVQAVKLGAVQYLPKPATPDEIRAAFEDPDGARAVPIPHDPPSVARREWEHIQTVLAQYGGNISATARALRMHRRTLQRKLGKRPVRD